VKAIPYDIHMIQCRMAQIRRMHHEEVREALTGAETIAKLAGHIRLYSWVALGTAAVMGMVTGRGRTVPMESANRAIAETDEEEIEEGPAPVADRSTIRPSFLREAARFLIRVAVRAAQNHAAYCLEDWIARRRMPVATKSEYLQLLPDVESSMPEGGRVRLERVDGSCEKLGSVMLVGNSKRESR
jgi:hypothetical protein